MPKCICLLLSYKDLLYPHLREGRVVAIPFFEVLQFDVLANIWWNSGDIPVNFWWYSGKFWKSRLENRKPTRNHNSAFPQWQLTVLHDHFSRCQSRMTQAATTTTTTTTTTNNNKSTTTTTTTTNKHTKTHTTNDNENNRSRSSWTSGGGGSSMTEVPRTRLQLHRG